MSTCLKIKKNPSGFILIAALSTITIFLTLAGGLSILAVYEKKLYLRKTSKIQALHIAEAGINYYRWHLAHDPDDFFDGTGNDPDNVAPNGPYQHSYQSSSGEISGYFSLEITEPVTGSTITTIKSTGWTDDFPNIKKIIQVKYGIPSLAKYSFLTNSDVWFGISEGLQGEMHSNGGIRMDGTNDSIISSARDTYICTTDYGCNIANCNYPCNWIASKCECPGIWGVGPNNNLWNYPALTVDFNSITMDIATMKTEAQTNGIYIAPQSKGIHIIFKNNGTFDVYKVKKLYSAMWQLNDDWTSWEKIAEQIKEETFLNNYTIPTDGLIFVEDDVWVEGTIKGRATLISAELPDNPNKRTSIYINNNINYLTRDGSNILGLLAQKNVKVLRDAPTDLTIDAILLAQNGRVFRNIYYYQYLITNSIEVFGGIITNKPWTWTWVDGSGNTVDGYNTTTSIFDNNAIYSAPPFFPTTGEYAVITWEEIQE